LFGTLISALLLFVLYEGFNFLPDKLVVIPGVFRISDSFFVILPLIILILALTQFRVFRKYDKESLLVLAMCVLLLINPLMSHIFFGQQYVKGLVLTRQNFFWLSFFVYVLVLTDMKKVETAINVLTILCGFYLIALIMTKYIPSLGLIHYDPRFYNESGSLVRFGEFRLFFPYGTVPIFFYCITLARLLHAPETESLIKKTKWLAFLVLVIYAILSTYTRSLVSSVLIVTIVGILLSRHQMLKLYAVFFGCSFVFILLVGSSFSDGEIPLIGDTKLAKMVTQQKNLQAESGREFQAKMFLKQLVRSPFTGVGTLAPLRDTNWVMGDIASIRKYGFFSGVDVGYPKIAGEYGVLGIAWVIWFLSYLYRSSRQTLSKAISLNNLPIAEAVARGHIYFMIYLLISGVTIAHYVHPYGLTIIAFSLAIMAVTRVSVNELVAANAAKVSE